MRFRCDGEAGGYGCHEFDDDEKRYQVFAMENG